MAAWLRRSPRRSDVSATGLSALDRLDTSGPRRITDLATLEGVSQPAVTALVNRLEQSGWVAREPDPDDRRAQLVRILPAGAQRLAEHRTERTRRVAARLSTLSGSDQAALEAALPALRHLLAHDPATLIDQEQQTSA